MKAETKTYKKTTLICNNGGKRIQDHYPVSVAHICSRCRVVFLILFSCHCFIIRYSASSIIRTSWDWAKIFRYLRVLIIEVVHNQHCSLYITITWVPCACNTSTVATMINKRIMLCFAACLLAAFSRI